MATPTALPAAFVSGDVLTAANLNLLRGAFRVLQVIQGFTSTAVTSTAPHDTFRDTGLTATITPLYNTSKILVLVSQAGISNNGTTGGSGTTLNIVRDGVQQQIFAYSIGYSGAAAITRHNAAGLILDSPGTTSAVVYKTQFKNIINAASVSVQVDSLNTSTIILMEISA
jgi:hypothetical protein